MSKRSRSTFSSLALAFSLATPALHASTTVEGETRMLAARPRIEGSFSPGVSVRAASRPRIASATAAVRPAGLPDAARSVWVRVAIQFARTVPDCSCHGQSGVAKLAAGDGDRRCCARQTGGATAFWG